MSFSNANLLLQLYNGLSTAETTPSDSPLTRSRAPSPTHPSRAPGNSTSCFDGMVVDDSNELLSAKPLSTVALVTPRTSRAVGPSFAPFTSTARASDMREMSISMNRLFDVNNADSLSRSKGGEQPVLEHLLSADGARTLSLGKHGSSSMALKHA